MTCMNQHFRLGICQYTLVTFAFLPLNLESAFNLFFFWTRPAAVHKNKYDTVIITVIKVTHNQMVPYIHSMFTISEDSFYMLFLIKHNSLSGCSLFPMS